MSPSSATPRENAPPLCVDLDGTLIKTDLMWESLRLLLWRNPLWLFAVLCWWTRGRAYLKQQLAARVTLDAAALPYNEPFLEFLRAARRDWRPLFLVTASDRKMATPVFKHVGIFDELIASDGKTNLRGDAKAKVLVERFGERGFDYAGNSTVDLPVWAHAREAIVVNASRNLAKRAAQQTKLGPTFPKARFAVAFSLSLRWPMLNLLCAVLAGLLLAAAFPKIGIAGFAWIAPALMLTAAHRQTGGDAFRLGYIAGLTFWLASLYWLLLIPVKGYPILGWFALSAYVALFPAAWLWLITEVSSFKFQVSSSGTVQHPPSPNFDGVLPWTWSQRMLWTISGAAIWVALEMVRARLFSGFPWNPIGASQFAMLPLIQIASVTGVYGVSFLVVWISLSLFSAALTILRQPTARHVWLGEIILPLAVLMAIFGFGLARLRETDNSRPTLRVTFVQPSIPQTMIWDSSENSNRFQQVLELSEQALREKTDLLIWPEAALPDFNEASFAAITNLIRSHGVWMIFGADDVEERPHATSNDKYDFYNAAFLFNPEGRFAAVYRKQKLVIFGEYIPLVRWLPFVKWFTPITGGFAAGDKPVPFELGDLRVKTSTLICFEDIFPHLVREYVDDDTDFLVNLTNDGWFGEGAEQWQHAAMAVFRAVENGLPLLRCCNNGITCWVDKRGRIQQIFRNKSGSVYGVGMMTAQIPVLTPGERHPPTFYNRHGDWFGWGCVAIAVLILVANIPLLRRKKGNV